MLRTPEIAVAISLKSWQDPQGDVVLHHSRGYCQVFFGCWTDSSDPADYLGQLTFHNAWAVNGRRSEFMPYQVKEHKRSCIYEIENSIWRDQVFDQHLVYYPEWKKSDDRIYRHFVVSGHDNYYEILATRFEEHRIPESEAGDLVRLIREA